MKFKVISVLLILLLLSSCFCESSSFSESEVTARLTELGYLNYKTDLSVAVSNFQRIHYLTVTGVLDEATVNVVMSDKAISFSTYIHSYASKPQINYSLKQGDKGANVLEMQKALNRLGYISEPLNSEYDLNSFYAVAMFQAVNSLTCNGVADSTTLSVLFSRSAVPLEDFENEFELKLESEGLKVKQLQLSLMDMGYFTGVPSGIFGTRTQQAVMDFQTFNNIEVNGVWGLYEQLLVCYGRCVTKHETEAYKASLYLSLGDTGDYVRELKLFLKKLGYFTGSSDDIFDEDLSEAVALFQQANQLISTGSADPETRALAASEDAVSLDEYTEMAARIEVIPGDDNLAVSLISRRLIELGYPLEETSYYDEELTHCIEICLRSIGKPFTYETAVSLTQLSELDLLNYDDALIEFARVSAEDKYVQTLSTLVNSANDSVGKPFQAGASGPDSFGTGGLVYYCYQNAGIAVPPTVQLQYDSALQLEGFSTDINDVSIGRQLFFKTESGIFTGLCIYDDMLVSVSVEEAKVVASYISEELSKNEFIGSISYIKKPGA